MTESSAKAILMLTKLACDTAADQSIAADAADAADAVLAAVSHGKSHEEILQLGSDYLAALSRAAR